MTPGVSPAEAGRRLKLAANLSTLFTERPFLERFGAAARVGFTAVECQLPYGAIIPDIREQLRSHQLQLVLHNLPAGDWAAGERGIGCHPDRVAEFGAGVEQAIEYATALGCRQLNVLAGIRPAGVGDELARRTFIANLTHAASRLHDSGLTLLIEPINTRDVPGFFLSGTRQAIDIIRDVDAPNVFLQLDVYHMQVMEGGIAETIAREREWIRHVQIADEPGRHEPGTGAIDFDAVFSALGRAGYTGWVGCEYNPLSRTEDGLGWTERYSGLRLRA